MKIIFLSSWFPFPADNGSKIRVYHLLKALAVKHEVTLFSFAHGTARPQESEALTPICNKIITVNVNPSAENRSSTLTRFLSLSPVASRPIDKMTELVTGELKREKYDLVIASTDVTAEYAISAGASMVKILELHNSLSRLMRERYEKQTGLINRSRCWLSWKKAQRYESRLFDAFDLVTMVSSQDSEEPLFQHSSGFRDIRIVPNGVDCRGLHRYAGPVNPNQLIYNGSITYSANLDAVKYFLSEIMPLVSKSFPDLFLTVTGATDGVDLATLQSDNSVRFTGMIDDIHRRVGQAVLCVAPIREGGGTRLKILEAMALGTPVVATTKAAEGLVLTHGKEILLADKPAEFAAEIIRLLSDVSFRFELANNARQAVESRYDWYDIGRRFVATVEAIVQKKKGIN